MVRPDPTSVSEEADTGKGTGGRLGAGKGVGVFGTRDRKVPHQVSERCPACGSVCFRQGLPFFVLVWLGFVWYCGGGGSEGEIGGDGMGVRVCRGMMWGSGGCGGFFHFIPDSLP